MNQEEVHWYYIDETNNDAQLGPFVLKDFKEKFLSGLITPESYCWHEEIEDWLKLKNIQFRGEPALHHLNESVPIPKPMQKQEKPQLKSSDIEEEIRERLRKKFGK